MTTGWTTTLARASSATTGTRKRAPARCEPFWTAASQFTAIVAGNDLIALGCYDVFAERGISCPDDVSVVGFNDMPFLDKLRPPLTTVSVPHYAIGAEAARMLIETIDEPDRHPRSLMLPLSLVVRQSTARPRT